MDSKDNIKVKKWNEERDSDDAPIWMSADEASGWASGWNAAIEAAKAESDDAPIWMSADEASGWASGWNAAIEAAKAEVEYR